jgi:hypothetical protein
MLRFLAGHRRRAEGVRTVVQNPDIALKIQGMLPFKPREGALRTPSRGFAMYGE